MSETPSPPASGPASGETIDFGFQRVPKHAKKPLVRAVFDSVAPSYDVMNDLMSLGIHRLWKRILGTQLRPGPNLTLLDLASGTGDIIAQWRKKGGGPVIATDINEAMLSAGRNRLIGRGIAEKIDFVVADAETLPIPDAAVDRVSIAFGLRNCTDKDAVLREVRRVLKPGGRFFCLEFSKLQIAVLENFYARWSFDMLPAIGGIIAKDRDSYTYLAESIRQFPDQESLAGMMQNAGLENVRHQNLSGGIVAIHSGWRL
jgi:demethylmenaquinone methyltransferase/2-methoxy-6-polyprenyl-1,4-benzoquinol methylase